MIHYMDDYYCPICGAYDPKLPLGNHRCPETNRSSPKQHWEDTGEDSEDRDEGYRISVGAQMLCQDDPFEYDYLELEDNVDFS